MEERIYIINLREAFEHTRMKRAERAVKEVKEYLKKHTKNEKISISNTISKVIYARAYKKCPRKIKVIAHIDKGITKAYLFGEEIKKETPKEVLKEGEETKVEKKEETRPKEEKAVKGEKLGEEKKEDKKEGKKLK